MVRFRRRCDVYVTVDWALLVAAGHRVHREFTLAVSRVMQLCWEVKRRQRCLRFAFRRNEASTMPDADGPFTTLLIVMGVSSFILIAVVVFSL